MPEAAGRPDMTESDRLVSLYVTAFSFLLKRGRSQRNSRGEYPATLADGTAAAFDRAVPFFKRSFAPFPTAFPAEKAWETGVGPRVSNPYESQMEKRFICQIKPVTTGKIDSVITER